LAKLWGRLDKGQQRQCNKYRTRQKSRRSNLPKLAKLTERQEPTTCRWRWQQPLAWTVFTRCQLMYTRVDRPKKPDRSPPTTGSSSVDQGGDRSVWVVTMEIVTRRAYHKPRLPSPGFGQSTGRSAKKVVVVVVWSQNPIPNSGQIGQDDRLCVRQAHATAAGIRHLPAPRTEVRDA
jgi:hypothetical protein